MLYDGPGNSLADYRFNIARAIQHLQNEEKVIVCCAMGISRSNAIALGVLLQHYKMEYQDACNLIAEKVPIAYIAEEHIEALERTFRIKEERRLGSWSRLSKVATF